jgi:hypothetical protein
MVQSTIQIQQGDNLKNNDENQNVSILLIDQIFPFPIDLSLF